MTTLLARIWHWFGYHAWDIKNHTTTYRPLYRQCMICLKKEWLPAEKEKLHGPEKLWPPQG